MLYTARHGREEETRTTGHTARAKAYAAVYSPVASTMGEDRPARTCVAASLDRQDQSA